MDETTSDGSAWALSALGNAIQSYVDRTVNSPQIVHDASSQYYVGSDGGLYKVGATATATTSLSTASNNTILLLVLGIAVIMLVKH